MIQLIEKVSKIWNINLHLQVETLSENRVLSCVKGDMGADISN